jgi:hypothetical protein
VFPPRPAMAAGPPWDSGPPPSGPPPGQAGWPGQSAWPQAPGWQGQGWQGQGPQAPPQQPPPSYPGGPPPPPERKGWAGPLIGLLALGLVAVVAVVAVLVVVRRGAPEPAPERGGLTEAEAAAGCTAVQQHPLASAEHITPDQQPSDWNSNPPTSGQHLAEWLPGGFYPRERDERAVVHSLEHGYVAVQHRGVAQEQVEQLRQIYEGETAGGTVAKLVVMPWHGLDSDGVALTAWRFSQRCQRVSAPVVQAFIDNYMVPDGRASVAPEPFGG